MKQRHKTFRCSEKFCVNIRKDQIPELQYNKHADINKRCRPDTQSFSADVLYIYQKDGSRKQIERPLIGITKEPLSSQMDYDMIAHPELLE